MKAVNVIVLLLIIVGGLNWGSVGAFDYNFVDEIFGADSVVTQTIYILVGLAAVYKLVYWVSKLADSKPVVKK